MTNLTALAKTHPTLHVGGILTDHVANTVTVSFDAFLGDDDLPTTITKQTFAGLAATRVRVDSFAGLNEMFGLTPDFS